MWPCRMFFPGSERAERLSKGDNLSWLMKYIAFSSVSASAALVLGFASLGSMHGQEVQIVQPGQVQTSESIYGPVVGAIPVPQGLTTEGVRTIVANCFAGREWTVRESAGNRVVGYLNHRGIEAQVTVLCDPQQITMYSNSWKLDRSGRPVIPEQPDRWLNFLRQDIAKRLAKSGLAR